MKAKEPHRVPLSGHAVALVKTLKEIRLHETLVFPSPREKVLSDMTLTALLRRVKAESDTPDRFATAHGFRSSFRDWASEHGYARDLAERALAHTVANKVEAAYHRTDLLEQRRPLMEAWAKHVYSTLTITPQESANTPPPVMNRCSRPARLQGNRVLLRCVGEIRCRRAIDALRRDYLPRRPGVEMGVALSVAPLGALCTGPAPRCRGGSVGAARSPARARRRAS